jgi:hypothetical protein
MPGSQHIAGIEDGLIPDVALSAPFRLITELSVSLWSVGILKHADKSLEK